MNDFLMDNSDYIPNVGSLLHPHGIAMMARKQYLWCTVMVLMSNTWTFSHMSTISIYIKFELISPSHLRAYKLVTTRQVCTTPRLVSSTFAFG